MKWFVNGQPTDYTGGRVKDEIVKWINKRSGPPSRLLTAAQLEETISSTNFLVAFIGKEGDEFKAFEAAASTDDKRTFVHTFDTEAATTHGISGSKIILFRKFDEPKVEYSRKYDSASINQFILANVLPTVFEITEEYSEIVFQGRRNTLFLFRDPNNADQKAIYEAYSKAARELKGKVAFAVSGTTDRMQKKVAEHVGGASRPLPSLFLVDQA